MIPLKTCPFCGRMPIVHVIPAHKHNFAVFMPDYPGGAFIECVCGVAIPGATLEEAAEKWNVRGDAEYTIRCWECVYASSKTARADSSYRCENRCSPCWNRNIKPAFGCKYGLRRYGDDGRK